MDKLDASEIVNAVRGAEQETPPHSTRCTPSGQNLAGKNAARIVHPHKIKIPTLAFFTTGLVLDTLQVLLGASESVSQ